MSNEEHSESCRSFIHGTAVTNPTCHITQPELYHYIQEGYGNAPAVMPLALIKTGGAYHALNLHRRKKVALEASKAPFPHSNFRLFAHISHSFINPTKSNLLISTRLKKNNRVHIPAPPLSLSIFLCLDSNPTTHARTKPLIIPFYNPPTYTPPPSPLPALLPLPIPTPTHHHIPPFPPLILLSPLHPLTPTPSRFSFSSTNRTLSFPLFRDPGLITDRTLIDAFWAVLASR